MPDQSQPLTLQETITSEGGEWKLKLQPELIYFRGHFSGMPVLPGVVSVLWAARALRLVYSGEPAVSGMRRLKFRRLMTPGLVIHLRIEPHRTAGDWKFRYFDDDGEYAAGVLKTSSCSSLA